MYYRFRNNDFYLPDNIELAVKVTCTYCKIQLHTQYMYMFKSHMALPCGKYALFPKRTTLNNFLLIAALKVSPCDLPPLPCSNRVE